MSSTFLPIYSTFFGFLRIFLSEYPGFKTQAHTLSFIFDSCGTGGSAGSDVQSYEAAEMIRGAVGAAFDGAADRPLCVVHMRCLLVFL